MVIHAPKLSTSEEPLTERIEKFIHDLTVVSHKHGIGISESPALFLLERDDFALRYGCDDQSRLILT